MQWTHQMTKYFLALKIHYIRLRIYCLPLSKTSVQSVVSHTTQKQKG